MEEVKDVGMRISEERAKRNVDRKELAKFVGMTYEALRSLESGETSIPRADRLLKMAAFLGANPLALVFGEDSLEFKRLSAAWPVSMSNGQFQLLSYQSRYLLGRIAQLLEEIDGQWGQRPDEQ